MNLTQGENRELAWLIERLKEIAAENRRVAEEYQQAPSIEMGLACRAAGLERAIMEIELLQTVGIEGVCPSPEQPGR